MAAVRGASRSGADGLCPRRVVSRGLAAGVFVARPELEGGCRVLESFTDRLKGGEGGQQLQADGSSSSISSRAYSELLYHPDPHNRSSGEKDLGVGRLAVHEQVEKTFDSLVRPGLLLRLSADKTSLQYQDEGSHDWQPAPAALLAVFQPGGDGGAGLGAIHLTKAGLQIPDWFLDLHKRACAAEADKHGCKNQLTAGGEMREGRQTRRTRSHEKPIP